MGTSSLTVSDCAVTGKPGASLAGVTVIDGSGDTSADDLMRGALANATVAATSGAPQFTYVASGDMRGALYHCRRLYSANALVCGSEGI